MAERKAEKKESRKILLAERVKKMREKKLRPGVGDDFSPSLWDYCELIGICILTALCLPFFIALVYIADFFHL